MVEWYWQGKTGVHGTETFPDVTLSTTNSRCNGTAEENSSTRTYARERKDSGLWKKLRCEQFHCLCSKRTFIWHTCRLALVLTTIIRKSIELCVTKCILTFSVFEIHDAVLRGSTTLPVFRSHPQILGARSVVLSKLHTDVPEYFSDLRISLFSSAFFSVYMNSYTDFYVSEKL
jgi:hypothetical protein